MREGELHGGPACFVRGDGMRYSFSYMHNGRPHGQMIDYREDGLKRNVKSTREETDVTGWIYYIGETVDGW